MKKNHQTKDARPLSPGRNLLAVAAWHRRGGIMQDRRHGRGGAYNRQGQWITEWAEEQSSGPLEASRGYGQFAGCVPHSTLRRS